MEGVQNVCEVRFVFGVYHPVGIDVVGESTNAIRSPTGKFDLLIYPGDGSSECEGREGVSESIVTHERSGSECSMSVNPPILPPALIRSPLIQTVCRGMKKPCPRVPVLIYPIPQRIHQLMCLVVRKTFP